MYLQEAFSRLVANKSWRWSGCGCSSIYKWCLTARHTHLCWIVSRGESDRRGFQSKLCHLLAEWPGVCWWASLGLSILLCRVNQGLRGDAGKEQSSPEPSGTPAHSSLHSFCWVALVGIAAAMGSLQLSDLHFAWKELEKLKGCPQNWIFLWKRSRSLFCRMPERIGCLVEECIPTWVQILTISC